MKARSIAMLVLAALLAAACQRPGTVPREPITPEDSPQQSPPTVQTTPCEPVTGGSPTYVNLTEVTVKSDGEVDEITFRFARSDSAEPSIPEYSIEEAEPPFQDTAERKKEVEGEVHLRALFHGASGVNLEGESFRITYEGPKELKPGFEVLLEAEEEDDFEATLSWILGLSRRSCPKVIEQADPLQLTIQLPH